MNTLPKATPGALRLPPSRVNMNFLAECNMSCPFCYCPFDGKEAGPDTFKRIIGRCYEWQVRSITFGGGDPWKYGAYFADLLEHTRSLFGQSLFVQVDTNGLGLGRKYYSVTSSTVDLLGLPLESPTREAQGILRQNPKHFDVVIRLLEDLRDFTTKIKINTVVSRENINLLGEIASLVNSYGVDIWSLYEFWPLGPAALENEDQFSVSHSEYTQAVETVRQAWPSLRIEKGSVEERWHSYFFVSHTGTAYTIDKNDSHKYAELGSIFDDDVIERWYRYSSRSATESRLRMRLDRA